MSVTTSSSPRRGDTRVPAAGTPGAEAPAAAAAAAAVEEPGAGDLGRLSRTVLWLIGVYQATRVGRLSPCRFVPTCSVYAQEAVTVHGAARGTVLALRRLARCHPLGGWGADPVPLPRSARRGRRAP